MVYENWGINANILIYFTKTILITSIIILTFGNVHDREYDIIFLYHKLKKKIVKKKVITIPK